MLYKRGQDEFSKEKCWSLMLILTLYILWPANYKGVHKRSKEEHSHVTNQLFFHKSLVLLSTSADINTK